ncbi:MAG: uracil-DNA glycosylase [Chloroflexi bacterium HGW-Chloroflexi-10]|nr:MAG: uracil-DNA glycosylase [Chloroflexi bacterium HGW-Chloroflexi-10]
MPISLKNHEDAIVHCRLCPRLVSWREEIAQTKRKAYKDLAYWGKPVPGFGDIQGEVLVVGLAPGAHGSNRTGRMFTGDASGEFLYPALFKAGFANQPSSEKIDDGLTLSNLFITAVCRCVPPDNKPTNQEKKTCSPFLFWEIEAMQNLKVVVTLGAIAHDSILVHFSTKAGYKLQIPFSHNRSTYLDRLGIWLISSYHPSRQNTQTGKLTIAMFDSVWNQVKTKLS